MREMWWRSTHLTVCCPSPEGSSLRPQKISVQSGFRSASRHPSDLEVNLESGLLCGSQALAEMFTQCVSAALVVLLAIPASAFHAPTNFPSAHSSTKVTQTPWHPLWPPGERPDAHDFIQVDNRMCFWFVSQNHSECAGSKILCRSHSHRRYLPAILIMHTPGLDFQTN